MDALDAPTGDREEFDETTVAEETPVLRTHESSPGRTVFTEDGNPDAWIATDLTIEVDR